MTSIRFFFFLFLFNLAHLYGPKFYRWPKWRYCYMSKNGANNVLRHKRAIPTSIFRIQIFRFPDQGCRYSLNDLEAKREAMPFQIFLNFFKEFVDWAQAYLLIFFILAFFILFVVRQWGALDLAVSHLPLSRAPAPAGALRKAQQRRLIGANNRCDSQWHCWRASAPKRHLYPSGPESSRTSGATVAQPRRSRDSQVGKRIRSGDKRCRVLTIVFVIAE